MAKEIKRWGVIRYLQNGLSFSEALQSDNENVPWIGAMKSPKLRTLMDN